MLNSTVTRMTPQESIRHRREKWLSFLVIVIVGLVPLFTLAVIWRGAFPPGDDAEQYAAIGRSLATGQGYKDPVGFWPQLAAYDRMPGWPALESLGFLIAPGQRDARVARCTSAVCLALAGGFFYLIARRLGVRNTLAGLAGLAVTFSPPLVALMTQGYSEVPFVLFVGIALWALLRGGTSFYWGALAFGLCPLFRTNFVLVPAIMAVLLWLGRKNRSLFAGGPTVAGYFFAAGLSLLPTLLWVIRNDMLTGRFPLLSSIEGETLYGSNNDVVAHDRSGVGLLDHARFHSREKSKRQNGVNELGSDLALSDYYRHKGLAWIGSHVKDLPLLILGKLTRAFVPIPWNLQWYSSGAFLWRFALDVLYIWLFTFWRGAVNRFYLLLAAAMFLTHMITVLVFWGSFRFTYSSCRGPFPALYRARLAGTAANQEKRPPAGNSLAKFPAARSSATSSGAGPKRRFVILGWMAGYDHELNQIVAELNRSVPGAKDSLADAPPNPASLDRLSNTYWSSNRT